MVEESPPSEHPFKPVVAIKRHLLPVVIGVGAKRCGYAPKSLDSTQKIGIDQSIVLNAVSWSTVKPVFGFQNFDCAEGKLKG